MVMRIHMIYFPTASPRKLTGILSLLHADNGKPLGFTSSPSVQLSWGSYPSCSQPALWLLLRYFPFVSAPLSQLRHPSFA